VLLQDEVDRPASYADYGSEFVPRIALIPRRPWLMPRLPIILPPINIASQPPIIAEDDTVDNTHFNISDSDSDSDSVDHIIIPQSDDIPDHIDIPICPPSPSHMQFPVSDDETSNAMDVVLSDDIEMPMSVVSTDSGSDLNDIVFPGSPIMTGQSPYVPDVVAINRDPTTGRFTAASFANFPDELLD